MPICDDTSYMATGGINEVAYALLLSLQTTLKSVKLCQSRKTRDADDRLDVLSPEVHRKGN